MIVTLPRLTSSLRPHYDVDQAYLKRKSILQSLKPRRSNDESELARELIYRWDEASTEVRQAYKKFLGAVMELIGDEVHSKEFEEITKAVYNLYTDSGMKSDSSKMPSEKK